MTTTKFNNFHAFILILLANLALYYPLLFTGFISLDDPTYVTDNYMVKRGLSIESIKWAFTTIYYGNWSPLTWLSHMVDYQYFGLNAMWHHATNIALHTLNSFLFYLLLKNFFKSSTQSLFASLIFAIHPLHVEPVAWISSRKDVLSGVFWFLTIILYFEYAKNQNIKKYLITLSCYFIGLCAKSVLVTLPVLLLVFDISSLNRISLSNFDKHGKKCITEKIPFLILSVIFAFLTSVAQNDIGTDLEAGYLKLNDRVANASLSLLSYLRKTLLPFDLTIFYPLNKQTVSISTELLALTFIIGLSLCLFIKRKSFPNIFIGWFWFCISIALYLQLTQIGTQTRADRWAYIPLAGICILLAMPLSNQKLRIPSSVIGLTYFSYFSFNILQSWLTPSGVFERALSIHGPNDRLYILLATSQYRENKKDLAEKNTIEALKFNPDSAIAFERLSDMLEAKNQAENIINYVPNISEFKNTNFSTLLIRTNILNRIAQSDKIKNEFIKKWGKKPIDIAILNMSKALEIDPFSADANYLYGKALLIDNQVEQALPYLKKASKLNPRNTYFLLDLGKALESNKNTKEAIRYFNKIIRIDPRSSQAHYELAKILLNNGKLNAAEKMFKTVIARNPKNKYAYNDLAGVYFKAKAYNQALQILDQGLKLDPYQASLLTNKAAVLLELKQKQKAIEAIELAKVLQPENPQILRLESIIKEDLTKN